MELFKTEDAAAQFVVAKKRREIISHGGDEPVIDRDRNVVAEERRFESGRIIPGASAENIGFNRIGERRRERELVILKFFVELVERPFAQIVIAFHEERAERTL